MRDPPSITRERHLHLLRSALLIASPTSFVVLEALEVGQAFQLGLPPAALGALIAGLLAFAAAVIRRSPFLGRCAASVAAFLLAAASAFVLTHAPTIVLAVLLLLAAGAAWLWYDELPLATAWDTDRLPSAAVGPDCCLALVAWYLVGPGEGATSAPARVAAVLAVGLCMLAGGTRIVAHWSPLPRLLAIALLGLPPVVSLGAVAAGSLPAGHGLDILGVGPALLLLWSWTQGRGQEPAWWGSILEHPARLLVVTFLTLSCLSAVLLSLPASSQGHAVSALDAAFTAVSAVCVTGLLVLDTPSTWSGFGQGVLLASFQLGGLGIMTFYAAAIPLLGRRLSLRHERALAGALSIDDRGHLFRTLGRVLAVTFGCELIGTLLLFAAFTLDGELRGEALWRAVFTSVSAFCNAGFALQSDSLVAYQKSPFVLHTVALLVVAGSLSPAAVVALPRLVSRRRRTLPLELKLIFTVTAALLLLGTLIILAFEWSGSLAHLGVVDRFHNAWLQSVGRTAGFNSVALKESHVATQTVMIFLMFIGGSPGSTAGGIKTTTFAALFLAVVAALQGRSEAVAFGRRLSHVSVYKAAAITTIGILAAFVVLVAILLTQPLPPQIAVFEVVSALGTVGLSLGGTELLDEIGKVLIILCMLAGRVGPLTLFVVLVERRYDSAWVYPHEELHVG